MSKFFTLSLDKVRVVRVNLNILFWSRKAIPNSRFNFLTGFVFLIMGNTGILNRSRCTTFAGSISATSGCSKTVLPRWGLWGVNLLPLSRISISYNLKVSSPPLLLVTAGRGPLFHLTGPWSRPGQWSGLILNHLRLTWGLTRWLPLCWGVTRVALRSRPKALEEVIHGARFPGP